MVKHTETIRRLLPTTSLCVFDQFVEWRLKGLIHFSSETVTNFLVIEICFHAPLCFAHVFYAPGLTLVEIIS